MFNSWEPNRIAFVFVCFEQIIIKALVILMDLLWPCHPQIRILGLLFLKAFGCSCKKAQTGVGALLKPNVFYASRIEVVSVRL